jgi:hypothetical protein
LTAISLTLLGCPEPIQQPNFDTETLSLVTFSPPAATYNTAQDVSLNHSNPGATIYYTTDGSAPAVGVSTEYTGPINIAENSNMTIRAIATAPGLENSDISNGSFVIDTRYDHLEVRHQIYGWSEPQWSTPGYSRRFEDWDTYMPGSDLSYHLYSVSGRDIDVSFQMTITGGANYDFLIYESNSPVKTTSTNLADYSPIVHEDYSDPTMSFNFDKTVSLKAGHTYFFTAYWNGGVYGTTYTVAYEGELDLVP